MSNYDYNSLTLDEKIGQLIVFGFDALDVNDHAINLIKNFKAGNVILFARNVKTPQQLFTLNQNLQKLALDNLGIPLFITIDQEGGMVTRIKNGGTFFPGAMTLSASDNILNAYKVGEMMGAELKAVGVNMNLAPVLDVNNNPYNPVIGVRSFSDDAVRVSEYGNSYIKGMQKSIIATAKHFPGHGDTKVDSHLALPKVEKRLEELEVVELYPFKKAIEAGICAIMSSHINFPAITENDLPTTLSRKFLTELLREKLKFDGLIITDCMQMKAIQNIYTTPEGVLMAVNAGANLICISHAEDLQIASIERLKSAVDEGTLSIETINSRVEKILEFKQKFVKVDLHKTYQNVQSIIESKETKQFVLKVVQDAVTLIKGTNFQYHENTLLIASEPISTTIADEDDGSCSIIKTICHDIPNLDTLKVSVKLTNEEISKVVKQSTKYNKVIFCSYNANIYQNQIKLIEQLQSENLYVFMMRNPYDSVFTSSIKNLVSFYEYTPNSVKVLSEYIQGSFLPKGILPVKL